MKINLGVEDVALFESREDLKVVINNSHYKGTWYELPLIMKFVHSRMLFIM